MVRIYELPQRMDGRQLDWPERKRFRGGGATTTKKINPQDLKSGFYENTQTNETVRLQQVDDGTYVHTQNGKCFALNPQDTENYKPTQKYHPFSEAGHGGPLPFP